LFELIIKLKHIPSGSETYLNMDMMYLQDYWDI
jgi:hypothetical protein